MKLTVEYVKTDSLKPYANNAKLHPAEQIEQIKKSITEFGFNDPIALWKDNEIIEGHGRLIAATELGIDKVPVIRLDELTDEQRRAYMLVHNKLTMNSEFDENVLEIELDDIVDIEMTKYGFVNIEIDDVTRKDMSEMFGDNYDVIVSCENEIEQQKLFEKLQGEGYTCRVSTL